MAFEDRIRCRRSKFLAMKRESGEYCLSFSERRETRELAIYTYTHTSGNSQVFMQTASSVSRRCTNHVECTFFNLSSCLLSPLFLFLFQTSSRHLGKMCSLSPRAHHRLRLCTHGYVFATRPRIPVEDRHTDVSLFLSLFFALSFVLSRAYTRSFFNDRINRGGAAIGDSFLPGTIAAMNDRACLPSIPPRMPFRIFVSIRSSQAAK